MEVLACHCGNPFTSSYQLSHLIGGGPSCYLVSRMDTQRTAQHSVAALLPIMGVVFIAFLIIGLAMPVLPLHVHQGLGLSTFIVGLVVGSQFAASLISRLWPAEEFHSPGPTNPVVIGLLIPPAS